jgi:uncharacterized protein YkwD
MDHRRIPNLGSLIAQGVLVFLVSGCGGSDGGTSVSGAGQAVVTLPPAPTSPPLPPAPAPPPAPISSPNPAPTNDAMLTAMLKAHNDARAAVGVGPVTLDTDLNTAARAYAQVLIANGRFEHSSNASRPNQGENLWAGTASAFSFQQMAAGWVDEKQFFIDGVFPNVSTTGNWQDVGHYTQIIWRNTTKIGCGIASNAQRDVLVCRYSPPGNFIGQRVF